MGLCRHGRVQPLHRPERYGDPTAASDKLTSLLTKANIGIGAALVLLEALFLFLWLRKKKKAKAE